MQKNINWKKMIAPVVVTVGIAALLTPVLICVVLPLASLAWGETAAVVFLGLYALVLLAILAGVIAAMVSRLREIRSGEEEDAKQY